MQRLLVYLTVIGLFLAACSTPAGPVIVPTEVVPTPAEPTVETPTEAPDPTESPAVNAAVQALAALLGLDPSEIQVVSSEAVEWSDSCLGIVYIDAICAQGIVPGFRLVLAANGQQYEYHTNADGTSLALAPTTVDTAAEAAVQAVRAAVAKALGLPEYRVSVVSVEAVEWTDSCLGIARIDASCLQALTPGYRIMVEANGQLFEYRTNADGSAVAAAPVSDNVAANPAVQAAIAALAKSLGLEAYQIHVVSVAPHEWPDACLGVAQSGVGCAQVITPGYVVVLETNDGQLYQFHTNQEGSAVQPASVALSWTRNGGIAGFCDELVVYRSGTIELRNCKQEVVTESTLAALSAEDAALFNEWLASFGPVSIIQDDGAVADSMAINLSLTGTGAAQPSAEEQAALLEWAQNVYTQLQPAS